MIEKKPIEEIRGELGKWAFIEKTGRAELILLELFCNGLLVIGGLVFYFNGEDGFFWGALIAVFSVIGTFYSYAKQGSHLECHEKGLMVVRRSGVDVIRFDDLLSFKYGVTDHYKNRQYQHTAILVSFLTSTRKSYDYSFTTHSHDSGKYGVLSELVSPFVAKRMKDDLLQKGAVVWSGNISLSPRGILTSRRTGKKREREESLFPFSEDLRYVFDAGIFRVFDKGNENYQVSLSCAAENFHPGFLLMKRLYAEAEEKGTLVRSKIVETKGHPLRKPEERVTCPACGFQRKWGLFKKYGAVQQTPSGSRLTCYSCHAAIFPIEGGV